MQNVWLNFIRAGLAGVIGWQAIGPNRRERVLQVLREVAEGLAEGQQNRPHHLGGASDVSHFGLLTPGDIGGGPAIIGSPSASEESKDTLNKSVDYGGIVP